jgi:hypothetical protein
MKTTVLMAPEEHFGIVVLANRADTNLPEALAWRSVDVVLGLPVRDWSLEIAAANETSTAASAKRTDSQRLTNTNLVFQSRNTSDAIRARSTAKRESSSTMAISRLRAASILTAPWITGRTTRCVTSITMAMEIWHKKKGATRAVATLPSFFSAISFRWAGATR